MLDLLEAQTSATPHDDTRLAIEGFVGHVRRGERPLADARHGHRATLTALFCRTALDAGQALTWNEFRTT